MNLSLWWHKATRGGSSRGSSNWRQRLVSETVRLDTFFLIAYQRLEWPTGRKACPTNQSIEAPVASGYNLEDPHFGFLFADCEMNQAERCPYCVDAVYPHGD